MRTPTGSSRGSTGREEPVEFKFLGPRCDHQVLKQLEPKNLSNFATGSRAALKGAPLMSATLKLTSAAGSPLYENFGSAKGAAINISVSALKEWRSLNSQT